MTIAVPRSAFTAAADRWRTMLALIAGTWAAILTVFHRDVVDLAQIYWNSTTFGHCLFVLPVVAWLVWQRRHEVSRLTPAAWWPGLAVIAAGAGGWFLGDIVGVALFRHVGLVLMLQGAVLALAGPQVARALLFPLAYMLFLVPYGESLDAPLQIVTRDIAVPLLHLFGVPATTDGVLITTPTGWFEVAEACSGAKFVIAMIAYGALVANVCFVSWPRRLAFFAVAMIVPVLANGVRAFGTIYAAHLTSVQAATGFDHIVYGWVFFGLVMAAVLAIGWRWFDRDPDAAWVDTDRLSATGFRQGRGGVVGGAAVGIAALAYLTGALVAARADALPRQLYLPEVPGFTRIGIDKRALWQPSYPTADHHLYARYADPAGHVVDVAVAVYAGQREGHELVAFGQGVLAENDRWVKVTDEPSLLNGRIERITTAGPVERVVGTWYRVGDMMTASDTDVKVQTLKAKLLGGPQAGVALHVSAVKGRGAGARASIAAFLAAAGSPAEITDAVLSGR